MGKVSVLERCLSWLTSGREAKPGKRGRSRSVRRSSHSRQDLGGLSQVPTQWLASSFEPLPQSASAAGRGRLRDAPDLPTLKTPAATASGTSSGAPGGSFSAPAQGLHTSNPAREDARKKEIQLGLITLLREMGVPHLADHFKIIPRNHSWQTCTLMVLMYRHTPAQWAWLPRLAQVVRAEMEFRCDTIIAHVYWGVAQQIPVEQECPPLREWGAFFERMRESPFPIEFGYRTPDSTREPSCPGSRPDFSATKPLSVDDMYPLPNPGRPSDFVGVGSGFIDVSDFGAPQPGR